jgi:3-phenylpropionate/cinnamic acid dioxygenase small subunit
VAERPGTDGEAITSLLYAYAERIDAGDFAGVAELLAHAEITFEGHDAVVAGREPIAALYERTTRRHADGTPRTKHVTTNVIVEVGPERETATARSYYTVLQALPGHLALQPVVAGRYHDRFERVDAAWRFAGRHIMIDLVGDLTHHLRSEP